VCVMTAIQDLGEGAPGGVEMFSSDDRVVWKSVRPTRYNCSRGCYVVPSGAFVFSKSVPNVKCA
jgi:hypothetical protein